MLEHCYCDMCGMGIALSARECVACGAELAPFVVPGIESMNPAVSGESTKRERLSDPYIVHRVKRGHVVGGG